MSWSLEALTDKAFRTFYQAVGSLMRPWDSAAAQILFDAADDLADAEAEREAWDENEFRDWRGDLIRPRASEVSCDPVECAPVGHPHTPGLQGSPEAAAASQRAASGQPNPWDEYLAQLFPGILTVPPLQLDEEAIRRLVREEIDRVVDEAWEPILHDEP